MLKVYGDFFTAKDSQCTAFMLYTMLPEIQSVHLAADVRMFSALDNLSAFTVVNALKSFKIHVRRPSLLFKQVAESVPEQILFHHNTDSVDSGVVRTNERGEGSLPEEL